jgi:predicted SAM-dependent methyltransferase
MKNSDMDGILPAPAGESWLDVGCGPYKLEGATGIDMFDLPGVDVVHNLECFPWPFQDSQFDHIVCRHSINHLNDIVAVMAELHRICKPGGIIEIIAPHYASDNFNTDPTHRVALGYRSLNYFCNNIPFKYRYYSNSRFEMIRRYISFRDNRTDFRPHPLSNPFRWIGLEQLINLVPRIYERFFVYWLPPSELYFKLRVSK